MAVRGGWRPLSGLICEIVNSVRQGNFTFVGEKSGKSQGISNTYGCGNHALIAGIYKQENLSAGRGSLDFLKVKSPKKIMLAYLIAIRRSFHSLQISLLPEPASRARDAQKAALYVLPLWSQCRNLCKWQQSLSYDFPNKSLHYKLLPVEYGPVNKALHRYRRGHGF